MGTDSVTYVVQKEFSNAVDDCIVGTLPAPPLVITTTSLPPGAHGIPYAQALSATGGNAPYTWKLVKGTGTLPKGVKLGKTTGILAGTPKAAGTYTFTVEALDTKTTTKPKTQHTATEVLTLTVG